MCIHMWAVQHQFVTRTIFYYVYYLAISFYIDKAVKSPFIPSPVDIYLQHKL